MASTCNISAAVIIYAQSR